MYSATTLPANLDSPNIEDKLREHLKQVKRTSFGSEYVTFRASRDEVAAMAESGLVNAFRRVVLDPGRGLVMLMAPSGRHEWVTGDIDRFVSCVATLQGVRIEQLRNTRWRREYEPKNTGNEADCSFYFGRKALDYVQAHARSEEEGDAYTFRVPADLVVEVGLTHEAKEKRLSYRDKGVVEFWQLNARPRKHRRSLVTVSFLDLQAARKPVAIEASLNLPEVTPAHVIRFMRLRSGKSLNHLEVYEAVRGLLEDESNALEIREDAAEYELEN